MASARKIAMTSHTSTCRATDTMWSTAQTAIASAKTARTVRSRKRMTRSATAGSIPPREEETVILEVRIGGHVAATLNTVLDPVQEEAATELAGEVVDALASGHIEPTASALEQYADRLR